MRHELSNPEKQIIIEKAFELLLLGKKRFCCGALASLTRGDEVALEFEEFFGYPPPVSNFGGWFSYEDEKRRALDERLMLLAFFHESLNER